MSDPTTTALRQLEDYVDDATVTYRRGEVVDMFNRDGFRVINIDAFPALPEGVKTVVDCHYVIVGFTEHLATLSHQEFYDLVLRAGEEGVFMQMPRSVWEQGPSYITIGTWIGDQTTALRFMACVQAHGLANVITPATLGITDQATAEAMAGGGQIMLSGLKDPATLEQAL